MAVDEKCEVCSTTANLMRAKNENGKIVHICEDCYNHHCEGYEPIP